MTETSAQAVNRILTDPSVSNWLKQAVAASFRRDPVDAIDDAEELLRVLDLRNREICTRINTNAAEQVRVNRG